MLSFLALELLRFHSDASKHDQSTSSSRSAPAAGGGPGAAPSLAGATLDILANISIICCSCCRSGAAAPGAKGAEEAANYTVGHPRCPVLTNLITVPF